MKRVKHSDLGQRFCFLGSVLSKSSLEKNEEREKSPKIVFHSMSNHLSENKGETNVLLDRFLIFRHIQLMQMWKTGSENNRSLLVKQLSKQVTEGMETDRLINLKNLSLLKKSINLFSNLANRFPI